MSETAQVDRLWNIHEVGTYLQIPAASIYKMTARRARIVIPHIRISGRLRFRRRDVDEWLTLLSVSNLETLRKMRRKSQEVLYGNDPPSPDARR
jgi:predicted DNA-binding transcriptional regulator AlpA